MIGKSAHFKSLARNSLGSLFSSLENSQIFGQNSRIFRFNLEIRFFIP